MKLTNAIADWTDKKLLRMDKVIRISYEKMAEMIITEYISCSDEIFRKKTLKTLKGGLFLTRKLKSKNDAKAYQKEMDIKAAKEVAEKINSITMKLEVKAGENGKIFGGVTAKEIAENLKKEYKIDIDKKKVLLSETIKTIGVHNIEIKLYEGIIAKLKLNVVS